MTIIIFLPLQNNLPDNCPNVLYAYIWHAAFVNTLARSDMVMDIFNSPKINLIAPSSRAGVLSRPEVDHFEKQNNVDNEKFSK